MSVKTVILKGRQMGKTHYYQKLWQDVGAWLDEHPEFTNRNEDKPMTTSQIERARLLLAGVISQLDPHEQETIEGYQKQIEEVLKVGGDAALIAMAKLSFKLVGDPEQFADAMIDRDDYGEDVYATSEDTEFAQRRNYELVTRSPDCGGARDEAEEAKPYDAQWVGIDFGVRDKDIVIERGSTRGIESVRIERPHKFIVSGSE